MMTPPRVPPSEPWLARIIQALNDEEVPKKYHEAVLDLYFEAAKEAYRVLRKEGLSVSM